MNKKILLLAGILALGATSFSAEGTRDFLDGFKDVMTPNENITGSWNQEFKAYTDTESKDDRKMKLNNEIGLNLTDKLSLGLETNTYMDYPGKDQAGTDEFTTEVVYNNGNIGDTDLSLRQRVKYDSAGAGKFLYKPTVNFESYIGADSAEASLEFSYARNTGADDVQKIYYDIDTNWTLGYGFTTEIEFKGAVTTSTGAATESLLYVGLDYDYNVYTSADEATKLDFYAGANVTPVRYNHKDNEMHSAKEMLIETETSMTLDHSWTNNFSTYGAVGMTTKDDTKTHTSNVNAQGYVALGLSYSM